jgi:hypothetical protein
MAEDAGQREGQPTVGDTQVGVAQPGRNHSHDRFVGARFVEFDLGKGERRAAAGGNRGFGGGHWRFPYGWSAQSSETTTDLTLV